MQRTFYRQTYIAPEYNSDVPLKDYIQETLLDFELKHLRFVINEYSQGFGQNLEPAATGSYTIVTSTEHRLTNILVKPSAGSGSYTYDINLSLDKKQHNREGDYIRIFFDSVASTNPTINVKNETGATIYTKTYDGSGTDTQLKHFILSNNSWKD